jgi:ATP-dependent Clp protease protease subunit
MNQFVIPPPIPAKQDVYAFFFSEINQISGQRFMNGISTATHEATPTRLHILFQSSGGAVGDGICLYNFLRNSPIEIILYNSGVVSSIAVISYLGAAKRIVSQHATFMIHRSTAPPGTIPTVERLKAAVNALKIDDRRTEAILRGHLKIPERKWSDLRHKEFWFTASDAVANGLATDIGDFTPSPGAKVWTFC